MFDLEKYTYGILGEKFGEDAGKWAVWEKNVYGEWLHRRTEREAVYNELIFGVPHSIYFSRAEAIKVYRELNESALLRPEAYGPLSDLQQKLNWIETLRNKPR